MGKFIEYPEKLGNGNHKVLTKNYLYAKQLSKLSIFTLKFKGLIFSIHENHYKSECVIKKNDVILSTRLRKQLQEVRIQKQNEFNILNAENLNNEQFEMPLTCNEKYLTPLPLHRKHSGNEIPC